MQHKPTADQIKAAKLLAQSIICLTPHNDADRMEGIEYVGKVSVLNVPDDPTLPRVWFIERAKEILNVLSPNTGDTVHVMGQQQLVQAINSQVNSVGGICRVESVTSRRSVDEAQSDGSVTKVSIFSFVGFRTIYDF